MDKYLDYFPIIAYFGFWLQGAAIGALMTGEPKLIALGVVTTPAMAAMVYAAYKIRQKEKQASALGD